MINKLVQSALQTGWLSVESEGLIRQVLTMRRYQSSDLQAIEKLDEAVKRGLVRREGRETTSLLPKDSCLESQR